MKCSVSAIRMHTIRKRLWIVRLLRLPRLAQQRTSSLIHWLPPRVRFFITCSAIVLSTTFLVSHYSFSTMRQYQAGDIVSADLVAPADLQVVDRRATQQRQREARERVAPVFHFDHHRAEEISQRLRLRLNELNTKFRQRAVEVFGTDKLTPAQRNSELLQQIIAELAQQNQDPQSPFNLSPQAVAALAIQDQSEQVHEAVLGAINNVLQQLIYDESEAGFMTGRAIQLVSESGREHQNYPASTAISVSEARIRLTQELQLRLPHTSSAGQLALSAALGQLITSNLRFDKAATEAAQRRAQEMVQPLIISLKRDQVLLRAGDVVTEEMLPLLERVRQQQLITRQPQRVMSLLVMVAFVYFALYQVVNRSRSTRLKALTTFWVASTAVLVQVALVRAGLFLASILSAHSDKLLLSNPFALQLAIPFAAGALVLSLLVSSQIALVSALIVSLLVGLMSNQGVIISLFALASSIAAIYSIERYRTRSAITRAILIIGGVNILTGMAAMAIANQPLTLRSALGGAVCGVIGALLTAGVASIATPIYESAFNILTDMKLLELSNADHPLLRELAIRTPGTNHHSFIVGTLAEAAAKAIGANPLLARIGCLYHDIGKLAAPKMYIENQMGGPNPHDRVDPRDSVRIITGHVRRGIKMAQEAKLPPQIIDFIPQHHGTRVLSYFYHKAKAQAEIRGEKVNIDDFRYPGPKPQTKEAVILMLSDAAEAAVRSLEEPSAENIRSIIKKITDNIVADGQLDECNVTIREVTAIRESLVNTLIGIYHQRISYPGFNPPSERQASSGSDSAKAGEEKQDQPPSADQVALPQQARLQST